MMSSHVFFYRYTTFKKVGQRARKKREEDFYGKLYGLLRPFEVCYYGVHK